MYWADKLAEEIIRRKPDKEEYVCAAGISPSGSVHIGNFRDIATSWFVCRALQKKGKKVETGEKLLCQPFCIRPVDKPCG